MPVVNIRQYANGTQDTTHLHVMQIIDQATGAVLMTVSDGGAGSIIMPAGWTIAPSANLMKLSFEQQPMGGGAPLKTVVIPSVQFQQNRAVTIDVGF